MRRRKSHFVTHVRKVWLKVIRHICGDPRRHLVGDLLSLSPRWHFWKTSQNEISVQWLLLSRSTVVHSSLWIVSRTSLQYLRHSLSVSSETRRSEPSPTALLPLFVKIEITREQHVSSYYAALCLTKNTQAAPWQLTTHSQLSNASKKTPF